MNALTVEARVAKVWFDEDCLWVLLQGGQKSALTGCRKGATLKTSPTEVLTMPSTLPRISTILEPALYHVVERLARKEGVSLSQKTRDLVLEALELIEDSGLETIVERRRKNKAPAISHAELKRRLRVK